MTHRDPLAALNTQWPRDPSWNAWQADEKNKIKYRGRTTSEKTEVWRLQKELLDLEAEEEDDGGAETKKKGERKKRTLSKKQKKQDSDDDDAEVHLSVAEAPVRRTSAFPLPYCFLAGRPPPPPPPPPPDCRRGAFPHTTFSCKCVRV